MLEHSQLGLGRPPRCGAFLSYWGSHFRAFIRRSIDQGRNFVGLHRFGRIGTQNIAKGEGVLHFIVQPKGLQCLRQDNRHPVVDGAQEFVGFGGDYGAGPDNIACSVLPRVPKSCEAKGFSRLHYDPHGPFGISYPLPLVETVGEDHATPADQCGAEAGALCHGFNPRIDKAITQRRVLGPGRNKPPAQVRGLSPSVVRNGQHRLCGRDIVPGGVCQVAGK